MVTMATQDESAQTPPTPATGHEQITSVLHDGERYYPVTSAQVYSGHSRWWLDQQAQAGLLHKATLPTPGGNRVFYRKNELDALLRGETRRSDPHLAVSMFGAYLTTTQIGNELHCHRVTVIRMLKLGAFTTLDPLTEEERARGQIEDVAPYHEWNLGGQGDEYRVHERAFRAFNKLKEWRAVPDKTGKSRWRHVGVAPAGQHGRPLRRPPQSEPPPDSSSSSSGGR